MRGILLLAAMLTLGSGAGQTSEDSTKSPPFPIIPSQAEDVQLVEKSPVGALTRSLIVPGWGQWYNRRRLKAGVIFLVESTLIAAAVVKWREANELWDQLRENPLNSSPLSQRIPRGYSFDSPQSSRYLERYLKKEDLRNTYLWWTAGVVSLSILDAYVDAHLHRFDDTFEEEIWLAPDASGGARIVLRYWF